jgi:phage regulator Rha-like protein
MTSLEIAARAGLRHDNVSRIIRRELKAIDIDHLKFEANYVAVNGARRSCYCLPGEYLLHILTAFDAKLRFALIRHWQAVNDGWAEPVKDVATFYVARLVEGTKEEKRLRYEQEISRIEMTGRKPSSWDRMLAGKP